MFVLLCVGWVGRNDQAGARICRKRAAHGQRIRRITCCGLSLPLLCPTPLVRRSTLEIQDSSKGGAFETGCSGLQYFIGCFIICCYPHPLHPTPTAPPFDEYPDMRTPFGPQPVCLWRPSKPARAPRSWWPKGSS